MHRFFLPPAWIQGNQVTITGPQAHQIARVLRMQPGDHVVVLDNSGWEIETQLTLVDRQNVRAEVVRRRLSNREPRTKVSIYQGALKSRNLEHVLQKGTELGVVEFVPVITERCVISDLSAVEKKRDRWQLIIQEAAEQSRRAHLPALRSTMLFAQACERSRQRGGLTLIPWEEETSVTLRHLLRTAPEGYAGAWPPIGINLFIGPEGGFSPAEIDQARGYGMLPVTLGPRILRSETAGLVAATAVLYELGDLG
jgi:16S rRNA (uracil1498-N3)-methyltransferase